MCYSSKHEPTLDCPLFSHRGNGCAGGGWCFNGPGQQPIEHLGEINLWHKVLADIKRTDCQYYLECSLSHYLPCTLSKDNTCTLKPPYIFIFFWIFLTIWTAFDHAMVTMYYLDTRNTLVLSVQFTQWTVWMEWRFCDMSWSSTSSLTCKDSDLVITLYCAFYNVPLELHRTKHSCIMHKGNSINTSAA